MRNNDGGPAFPRPTVETPDQVYEGDKGMSLRDWFAGQALAGILAEHLPEGVMPRMDAAQYAYKIADAMLAESVK